jgi:hypothetical protein
MGCFDMLAILFAILLITSYCLLGGIIKFLDDVHDRDRKFSRRGFLCWGLTIFVIVLLDIWIYFDVYTALLALSLAAGLILIQKVDNYQFMAVALCTLPVAVYFIFQASLILLIPLMLLALAPPAVLDEVLHDHAQHLASHSAQWLVRHRPLMKIVVLVLPFLGLFTIIHTIAFLGFDITYDLVTYRLGE